MSLENFFTDTHCHLDFSSFDQDREMVIDRARELGIERMLNPGIDLKTSREAIRLASNYEGIYAAVGVHPNTALSWDDETYQMLAELARSPKVVAIGEIGLDYYRQGAPGEAQRRIFQLQLNLAAQLGLPVIIHNRCATSDVQDILEDWIGKLKISQSTLIEKPGVLHSFSGSIEDAHWAVENNFFIGINGPVTYKNGIQLQEVVRTIPLRNILVETDAPFLPPHPHRGKRNEPAHIALIAGKIAELRTIDKFEVVQTTSANAARLFCWRETD